MRIAFLVSTFPAVTQTFILNQLTGLLDQGHDVQVFAYSRGDNSVVQPEVLNRDLLKKVVYHGARLNGIEKRRGRRFLNAIRLMIRPDEGISRRVLFRSLNFFKYGSSALSLSLFFETLFFLRNGIGEFDIVHCHFGPNGALAADLKAVGAFSSPLITTFYGYDVIEYPRARGSEVYSRLFEHSDLVLSLSQQMSTELVDLGCPSEKICVHYLGFQPTSQAVQPSSTPINRVVSVARFVEKKGLKYAIEAFSLVRRARPELGLEYWIVGDGPLRENLEKQVIDLGLGDAVKLVGWKTQKEVEELLLESLLLMAPSVTSKSGDREGTPTAIIEALCLGVPVLSTFHSGIPEVIANGVSGTLVSERDVHALSAALLRMLEDRRSVLRMAETGKRLAAERFDIVRLNKKLCRHYGELLRQS